MKVIVKPSSSTLCELEVTTEKAKEKELLEQREEVYKFLNPEDMKVVISSRGKILMGLYKSIESFVLLN